ncbi:hypothetical protein DK847_13560 [Aestuariivirga litoralis]|uniref:DUF945 domain-containing protein n=1 Tax=Aestuariivirga litoralis TaxID=2650924 RepID=A0A2W2AL08_9HYPH|nr:hypothetical protein [Aestuariivirga litoralis]PZF76225.1 hypothetical protein DK847_13560 [Aestuariivirga litoralis]
MKLFHKILAVACLSSVAVIPGLAHAEDVPPAIQAFLDNLQRQTSAKPSYESLKVDGANATITNLTLTKDAKGDDPALSVKTAEVGFTGIADQGNALWQVGKATFTNTSVEIKGKDAALTASIPNASAEGWYIRATPASPTPKDELLATLTFANKMSSGPITINASGQTLKIDSIDTSWSGDPATGLGKFSLKVSNLAVPETTLAFFDTANMWKQMGYSGLNFDITTDGDLTQSGDNLAYSFNLTLGARDVGALSLKAAVNNLPVSAYAQMLKDQMAGKGIDFAAMAPQLQGVEVQGGSIRFDDASITAKMLPLVAAMQGMDPKVLLASIPPTVQLAFVQFQNEALTKQAVDAVTKFLADPKSLMLSVKPATPIKVSEIMALDPAKPSDAVTRLGVTVTANE